MKINQKNLHSNWKPNRVASIWIQIASHLFLIHQRPPHYVTIAFAIHFTFIQLYISRNYVAGDYILDSYIYSQSSDRGEEWLRERKIDISKCKYFTLGRRWVQVLVVSIWFQTILSDFLNVVRRNYWRFSIRFYLFVVISLRFDLDIYQV